MKTLRKIIPLFVLGTTVTGCTVYSPKPGKKENVIGTYELVTYNLKHDQTQQETYDAKAEKGVVAYFTVPEDGYAYYAYKDNNTPARITQMYATFEYDSEKTNLVSYVALDDGVTKKWEWEKEPGCLDEPRYAFRDEAFKKTLNYTITHTSPAWYTSYHEINYQAVVYKKISKDASLAKLNSLMGTSFSFDRPYEMKALSGRYVYRCQPVEGSGGDTKGIYEYGIIDYDTLSNGQVDFIYSLKSNPGRTTKKLNISVSEPGRSLKLEGLGKTFYSEGGPEGLPRGGFSTKMDDYGPEESINWESFSSYYSSDLSVEEIIELERTPQGPYVMHRVNGGQKEFAELTYNESYELFVNGLELQANEEFAVCQVGSIWSYFEDYQDDGTAGGKVVEGSVGGTVWKDGEEVERHNFKVTETGTYDIKVDTYGKVHVVHQ